MNRYIFIAGLISAAATIGHASVSRKKYLKPMLKAEFDPAAKKIMHCMYHYVSAFSCLSTVMLLIIGLNIWFGAGIALVILFITTNYLICAILQMIIAVRSGIPNGLFKLFQWIFFLLIALFSFLGIVI